MTFYKWLKLQRCRVDVVGDFAKDAITDKHRPKSSIRKTWIKYLHSKNACEGAIYACHKAYDQWEEYC